jgi:hypothetical protein
MPPIMPKQRECILLLRHSGLIKDLFGTELAMIFSFHVGTTNSVMQRMQLFFLSVFVRHFVVTAF